MEMSNMQPQTLASNNGINNLSSAAVAAQNNNSNRQMNSTPAAVASASESVKVKENLEMLDDRFEFRDNRF